MTKEETIQQIVDIVEKRMRADLSATPVVDDWRKLTIPHPDGEGWITLDRLVHDLTEQAKGAPQQRALRSIHMLARRAMARPDKSSVFLQQILTLCENNGVEPTGVLR